MSPHLLPRFGGGVAAAVIGMLIEIGLIDVVAAYPYFVVSFAAVLVATVGGGLFSGVVAAATSWLLSSFVTSSILPAEPVRPVLDAITVGLAFTLGGLLPRAGSRPLAEAGRRDREPAAPQPTLLVDALAGGIADMAGSRSTAQVADALVRGLGRISGATTGVAYVRAQPEEALVSRARTGAPIGTLPTRIDPADPGPLGRAVRNGRWIETDERVTIPILDGSEVIAVVDLVGGHPSFDDQARAAAVALGRVAADAVVRDRLRLERRAAGSQATVAAGRVSSFSRLASELAGAVTVERVGTVLVEHAVSAVGAEFGLVYAIDARDGACELVHARGYPVGLVQRDARLVPTVDGPVTRAASSGRSVEVASPEAWRDLFPASSDLLAMTGTRALIAVPLGGGERSIGVLMVGWSAASAPTADHRGSLAAIADQGAQALERARLHAQERDAQQLQEAFISVISHELRTPITTILAGSRILRRRLGDDTSADLALDIEAESDRLFRIVEDLLVLSRLERRNLSIAQEPVHLSHLVDRVIGSEARRWPTTRFVGPSRTRVSVVRGEETYVEQVLRNLLSNAAKYGSPGTTVTVALEDEGDDVAVRVLDEGPGIARGEVEQLFGLFYRSPATAASAAGAGIGLFVSRRLVDEMGGRMWARNRPEGGAEFGFSLGRFPADDDEIDEPADGASGSGDEAGSRSREAASATTGSERPPS